MRMGGRPRVAVGANRGMPRRKVRRDVVGVVREHGEVGAVDERARERDWEQEREGERERAVERRAGDELFEGSDDVWGKVCGGGVRGEVQVRWV